MNERVSVNPEIARRSKYVKKIIAAVNYKGCEDHEDSHTILCDFQKEIKAEAYKEFAYELMQIPDVKIYKHEIKNLLKEKVGENDAS